MTDFNSSSREDAPGPPAGAATDARGVPVLDPSNNVMDLVNAAIRRVDDLREAEARRTNDLREADHRRIQETNSMRDAQIAERQHFNEEIRKAETDRINAIRAVDVEAVRRAADVASTQATALAATVVASAEALRSQVAQTAAASSEALAQALDPIKKDIADLRKTQYEQAGQKTQQTEAKGSNQWAIGFAMSAVLFLISIISFIMYVVATSGKG